MGNDGNVTKLHIGRCLSAAGRLLLQRNIVIFR
jgi:hypothetical protein